MEYRNLGRTGVKVSAICLGTMNFGHRTTEPDAISLIHQAIDAGVNFIDTANFYGQGANDGHGQGLTEQVVGKALQGKRERIVLATKFTLPMDWKNPNARGGSRRHLIAECEASLRRLNTDYIDLYQIHRPDPSLEIDETLHALDDLVRAGKVRYIGSSMFPAWQVMRSLWVSKQMHLNRVVTEQSRYNIVFREIERELLPMAQSYGIGILAYAPLMGGLLTGKYQREQAPPMDSRLQDDVWKQWASSFLNNRVFDVIDLLQELATEKACTVSQLALAWVMQQPGITAAIIGPRTEEQLQDNLQALSVTLTEADRQQIDAAVTPGTSVVS